MGEESMPDGPASAPKRAGSVGVYIVFESHQELARGPVFGPFDAVWVNGGVLNAAGVMKTLATWDPDHLVVDRADMYYGGDTRGAWVLGAGAGAHVGERWAHMSVSALDDDMVALLRMQHEKWVTQFEAAMRTPGEAG